ncbi:peptidoglycan-binding protein [Agromyces sp. NPDC060279]|uniref:peptidoglycan-binding domain-containing protein n=1 Tax=Agromyces sp. NPDC060279 TaxID=3347092 RepID=UPI003654ECB4
MMERNRPPHTTARWPARLVVAALLLGAGALVGWSVSAVFVPPSDALATSGSTHVEVVAGEVGSSVQLTTVASWPQTPAGTNRAAGTVTSVAVGPGDEVGDGAELYSVDLRPVVVATGAVPAFRPLTLASEGADVQQLQQLLAELGQYDGLVDGEFGPLTEAAVKRWQESLGVPADGVVQAGDLVFVPELPGRISLDDELVRPGAGLVGGEAVVSTLPAEPQFVIPVGRSQAASMPPGTAVAIQAPDGASWQAVVAEQLPSGEADDQLALVLGGADGASICGAGCGALSARGDTPLPSTVVTAETVRGLVVPVAALGSAADGTVAVVDERGRRHPVEVVAAARGMAVVEGVDAGLRVRVPAPEGGDPAAEG